MMDRIPLGLNNPYTGIVGEAEEVKRYFNLDKIKQVLL